MSYNKNNVTKLLDKLEKKDLIFSYLEFYEPFSKHKIGEPLKYSDLLKVSLYNDSQNNEELKEQILTENEKLEHKYNIKFSEKGHLNYS